MNATREFGLPRPAAAQTRRSGGWPTAKGAVRFTLTGLERLAGGLGTASMALVVLTAILVSLILCGVGVGFVFLPVCLRAVRAVADRERSRLARWGHPIASTGQPPSTLRAALGDPPARRELGWLLVHAILGFTCGVVGVLLPVSAFRDISFLLWWRLLPTGEALPSLALWTVTDWPAAFAVAGLGCGWIVATVLLTPGLAWLQAAPARRLLAAPVSTDLSLRVAELTATRAAALDAHATELRRIERALHDGAQNRLVAVTVLLGITRQALARDPSTALESLDRAQGAAEAALADLRSVARTILPPVLSDRGLSGAIDGLAAASPIPCRIQVEVATRCAAAVEATAYFTVAEALTNAVRHSGASRILVAVRGDAVRLEVTVQDDGVGGANEQRGSGLIGIRRRAEAIDGAMSIDSPPGGPTRVEVVLPCG